jgi:hypothetical protein
MDALQQLAIDQDSAGVPVQRDISHPQSATGSSQLGELCSNSLAQNRNPAQLEARFNE